MHFVLRTVIVVGSSALLASSAVASVTQTTNFATWQAMTRETYTTIDFTGFRSMTVITTQYLDAGVVFTSPMSIVDTGASYTLDGHGLINFSAFIAAEFDTPQHWVGIHHYSGARAYLYYQGTLIYESLGTTGPPGSFAGFVSTQPFDKVVFENSGVHLMAIDNLYFGHSIPAPGALAVFTLALFAPRRRRR